MTRDITRRDAIRATGASIGALLLATSGVLAACGRDTRRATNGVLTADQQDLAEEIADTLLPTTPASPGAKAAGTGRAAGGTTRAAGSARSASGTQAGCMTTCRSRAS